MRDIELRGGTAVSFTATIEGPWKRCVSCDGLYLRPKDDVFEAFAEALDNAGVRRY